MSNEKVELNQTTNTQKNQPLQQESSDNPVKKNEINPQDILITQDKLTQIKKDLDTIIEASSNNRSFFSDASIFWGELALWKKILTGLVLTIPLVVAIVFNIWVVVALSATILLVFVAISIVLDNHYNHTTANIQQVKDGVLALADLLGVVINSLAQLGEQFKQHINALHLENKKLSGHSDNLGTQVGLLTTQVSQFSLTERELSNTIELLEQTANTLEDAVTKHAALLDESRIEFKKVIEDQKTNTRLLSEEISELHAVQEGLTLELNKAKKMAIILQGVIESFSQIQIADEEKKRNFQEKLNVFISDKEASFDCVAERMSGSVTEIESVKDELKEVIEEAKELNIRREQQIDRLEKIYSHPSSTKPIKNINFPAAGQHGFYSTQKEPAFLESQLEERIELGCS